MTDRELLELSAKAAGIEYTGDGYARAKLHHETGHYENYPWNPLTDDGDALRLVVKLGLSFDRHITGYDEVVCGDFRRTPLVICPEPVNDDPYAATRRAIVRAAAEIGKELP